jgi:hypothetical protein
MIPYDAVLRFMDRAVEASSGFTASDLIVFFYGLNRFTAEQLRWDFAQPASDTKPEFVMAWPAVLPSASRALIFSHLQDVCVSGFMRNSREAWQQGLLYSCRAVAAEAGLKEIGEARCESILDFLTRGRPGIVDDRPNLFLHLSDKTVVLDLLNASSFFQDFFARVGASAEGLHGLTTSKRRAGLHEEHAAAFFGRELGIPADEMIISKRLVVAARTVEVDMAFVFRRTLFVIDCKATQKDAAYLQGIKNKWFNRLETYRAEIETKCPLRIEVIRSGGAMPTIGADLFDHAEGLVCTAAVEYLPSSTEEPCFWHGSCAKVAPPEELLATIRKIAT